MKKAKRLVSLLLAIVMLLSLAVSAGAAVGGEAEQPVANKEEKSYTQPLNDSATVTGKPDDTSYRGTINVKNAKYGETYSIYQILYLDDVSTYTDPTSGITKTSYSYIVNEAWRDFVLKATDSAGVKYFKVEDYTNPPTNTIPNHVTWNISGTTNGTAPVIDFAQKALRYAKKQGEYSSRAGNEIAPSGTYTINDTSITKPADYDYKVIFTNAGLGYYLLDSSVGALCSLTTAGGSSVDIQEKNSTPTVTKQVHNGLQYDNHNTADVGSVVYFRSHINVPYFTTNLYFNDTMNAGLQFNDATSDDVVGADVSSDTVKHAKLTVTYQTYGGNTPIELQRDVDYKVIKSGDDTDGELESYSFRIKFLKPFYDKINAKGTLGGYNSLWTVTVFYSAILTEDAVDVTDGVPNKANVSYGETPSFTPDATTKTYTFNFNVAKYTGDITSPTYLSGAEFRIYQLFNDAATGGTDKMLYYKFKKEEGSAEGAPAAYICDGYTEDPKQATTIVTNNSGKFIIKGVNAGIYRIEETKAPASFNPLRAPVVVRVNADGTVTFNGTEMNPSDTENPGYVMIKNNSGTELPETGGIGTTIFYVAGSILLIGAAILLIVKKRMSDEK